MPRRASGKQQTNDRDPLLVVDPTGGHVGGAEHNAQQGRGSMKISEERRGDILNLRVGEARGAATKAQAFREALRPQIDAGHGQIVLDLSAAEFMASSGLGALVSCVRRLGSRGSLAIAGAQGAVTGLFTL